MASFSGAPPSSSASKPAGFQGNKTRQPQAKKAATTKALALKDYRLRLRDNIRSLRENFSEILKSGKIEDDSQASRLTQFEHEQYEMQVRATNMVRAAESILKLISDVKEFMILNDFAFVNETLASTTAECREVSKLHTERLSAVKEDAAAFLQEVEQEYYNSNLRL